MDPVVTGGLIGTGGTLLGVLSQEAIAGWRERERNKRLRLRAVSAVEGELLNTVSVLDKALQRGAWWPEGDEPRSDEWQRYRDVLADEFDEEILTRGTIVYNTIRSLAATCSSPLTPVGWAAEADAARRSAWPLILQSDLDRRPLAHGGG